MLRAPQSAAGKAVRCKCGQIVQVPSPVASAVARSASAAIAAARPAAAAKVAAAPRTTAVQSAAPKTPSPVPARTARATAAAATPAVAATGSIFDELTDSDWNRESPIKRAYAPPPVSKDGAVLKKYMGKEVVQSTNKSGTPGGLIALSVLNFIGSIFYIFAGVAIVALVQVDAVMQQLEAVFPAIRLAATLFCAYFIAWGIYLSVVGVGLLQRAPWGWCVAGVSYAHAAVDRCYYVVDSIMEGLPASRMIGMIGGVMVMLGIVGYIYKAETRRHFGVKSMTPVIICAAIGIILAIVSIVVLAIMVNSAEAMIPAEMDAVGMEAGEMEPGEMDAVEMGAGEAMIPEEGE